VISRDGLGVEGKARGGRLLAGKQPTSLPAWRGNEPQRRPPRRNAEGHAAIGVQNQRLFTFLRRAVLRDDEHVARSNAAVGEMMGNLECSTRTIDRVGFDGKPRGAIASVIQLEICRRLALRGLHEVNVRVDDRSAIVEAAESLAFDEALLRLDIASTPGVSAVYLLRVAAKLADTVKLAPPPDVSGEHDEPLEACV
jgi:hypothetical protein